MCFKLLKDQIPLTGSIWQHPVKWQSAKFKLNYYKYFIQSQVQYTKLKLYFLLIQPPCQISKRLYGESRPCYYVKTASHHTNTWQSYFNPPGATKLRNNNIINALPLKIFCWHFNMSQKHHKWSFCSINSIIISPKCQFIWRVWFRKAPVPTPPTWLQII